MTSEPTTVPTLRIPPRPRGALSGSQFAESIRGLSGAARDQAILEQIQLGNVPDFMRQLQPVEVGPPGGPRITIFVTPDYISIGSNEDSLRVPMGLHAAASIATGAGAILPTTRMVDDIARQATIKLEPTPLPPGPGMTSIDYFIRHDAMNDRDFQAARGRLGQLTAGDRKDLVLTPRLDGSDRVAIYGWHHRDGRHIQNLNARDHEAGYADYSHGVRLVSEQVWVNDHWASIYDVLADRSVPPNLSRYLSNEGPFPQAERLMTQNSDVPIRRGAPPLPRQALAAPPPTAFEPPQPAAPAPIRAPTQPAPNPAYSPPPPPPAATAPRTVTTPVGAGSVDMSHLRSMISSDYMITSGSTGDEVRELKAFLIAHGYTGANHEALDANDVFDNKTYEAVRQFQTDQGIKIDGIVGPQTMGKLNMTNLMAGMDMDGDGMVTVREVRAKNHDIQIADNASSVTLDGVIIPLNQTNQSLNRNRDTSTTR